MSVVRLLVRETPGLKRPRPRQLITSETADPVVNASLYQDDRAWRDSLPPNFTRSRLRCPMNYLYLFPNERFERIRKSWWPHDLAATEACVRLKAMN